MADRSYNKKQFNVETLSIIDCTKMNQLRGTVAFVTAATHGGFTRAARVLGLSPQAIAASVARLEAALEVRLFNRTTRSLALTEEGQRYLVQAERALTALDHAMQSVRDHANAPAGLVRITCGAAFGRGYVMPLLPAFARRHPEVRLDLALDDRKVDLVRDGYDVAIRGGAIADSSLVTRRICALTGAMVAAPGYLEKRGVPRIPDDLHRHQIIQLRFSSGRTLPWNLRVRGRSTIFEPRAPSLILSDTESVCDAALLGLGISSVSLYMAIPHLRAGRLKVVLQRYNDPGRGELVIHYPHREYLAPRIKAFVEFVLTELKQHPDLHVPIKLPNSYLA
jgi:DNA-binding transcriptional LysR family regulator